MARVVLHNRRRLIEARRALRSNLTEAEAALWRVLRYSTLDGRKFRRQHSIGRCIVDFYCPAEKLVIELDGSVHDGEEAFTRDGSRTRFLNSAGVTVLRFPNSEIRDNLKGVLAVIRRHFNTRR